MSEYKPSLKGMLLADYNSAKKTYHRLGEALFKSRGPARTKLAKEYSLAKRGYHAIGKELRKARS